MRWQKRVRMKWKTHETDKRTTQTWEQGVSRAVDGWNRNIQKANMISSKWSKLQLSEDANSPNVCAESLFLAFKCPNYNEWASFDSHRVTQSVSVLVTICVSVYKLTSDIDHVVSFPWAAFFHFMVVSQSSPTTKVLLCTSRVSTGDDGRSWFGENQRGAED